MKFRTQGKIAIAILIIALSTAVIYLMKVMAPEAAVAPREEPLTPVKVVSVEETSTSVKIRSQGIIEAPTATNLAAEVGGNVTSVSKKFKVGQDFDKGDILIEIDPADYASALAQAEANVADAQLNLSLEEGRAKQALRDWKSVGKTEDPSALLLRTPHLKSANAKLTSANAAVEKAKRDMERTKIRAPYACRISETYTEVGSFVTPGSRIADVYELGGFEVRLPVALDDYAFIEGSGIDSSVTLSARIAGEEKAWNGNIIRGEGVIDRSSRSVYLVGKIEDDQTDKFLSPGLFVKAIIAGRTLENIIEIPRKALYKKDLVYVIDKQDKLNFRTIMVERTERDRVLVRSGHEGGKDGKPLIGLVGGERVCTVNLAAAVNKMKVKVLGDEDGQIAAEQKTPNKIESGGAGAEKSGL